MIVQQPRNSKMNATKAEEALSKRYEAIRKQVVDGLSYYVIDETDVVTFLVFYPDVHKSEIISMFSKGIGGWPRAVEHCGVQRVGKCMELISCCSKGYRIRVLFEPNAPTFTGYE